MMNKSPIIVLMLAFSVTSCRHPQGGNQETYVPTDLQEAHSQLLKLLPSDEIVRIKGMKSEDEMIEYHFGLGMWMRNNWGLWQGGKFAKYFSDLGIRHPDDMSGIILNTFWCHLHDKPFRLEERIAYYQRYWRLMAHKPKDVSVPDGTKLEFLMTSYWQDTNGLRRVRYTERRTGGENELHLELLSDGTTNCLVMADIRMSEDLFRGVLRKIANETPNVHMLFYSLTPATDKAIPGWTAICAEAGFTNITVRHTTNCPPRTLEIREEDITE